MWLPFPDCMGTGKGNHAGLPLQKSNIPINLKIWVKFRQAVDNFLDTVDEAPRICELRVSKFSQSQVVKVNEPQAWPKENETR